MFDPSSVILTATALIAIATQRADMRAKRIVDRLARCVMQPTIGIDGRLHAPCNGFEWEGSVYAGGEYLPDDGGMEVKTKRYMTTLDVVQALQGMPHCTVSNGKVFNDNMTYVYITGPNYIIANLPDMREKIIVEEDGKFPVGQTWKFSFKRFFNANMYQCEDMDNAEWEYLQSLNKKMVGYFRPMLTA